MSGLNGIDLDNDRIAETESCCVVSNACGYTLKQGMVFVASCTIITAMIALLPSMMFLMSISSKMAYNSNPIQAINLICALMAVSTAFYEIIISIIMLSFLRKKQMVFMLTLWFGSNVVLLTLYFFLIVARALICFVAGAMYHGILTIALGIIYEAIYMYFCMIVCSYESFLDPETIYI